MKSGILTIGTEVVDGEIVNTNSSWLASELTELGLSVTHHMSVPDDRVLMLQALAELSKHCQWIFLTGGLGPTTDDITREIVAEYTDQKLRFEQTVWDDLHTLFSNRGIQVTDNHRRQCEFPEKSEIFPNPVGSALGFACQREDLQIVVLPGPPAELAGVFNLSVRPKLVSLKLMPPKLLRWVCLGIAESKVAEIVEELVESEDVEMGYRANVPFVHVKCWVSSEETEKRIEKRLSSALRVWTVSRSNGDPALKLVPLLKKKKISSIHVLDEITEGYLAQRFFEIGLFCECEISFRTQSSTELSEPRSKDSDCLELKMEIQEPGAANFSWCWQGQIGETKLVPPYKIRIPGRRAQKFFSESALQFWIREFSA